MHFELYLMVIYLIIKKIHKYVLDLKSCLYRVIQKPLNRLAKCTQKCIYLFVGPPICLVSYHNTDRSALSWRVFDFLSYCKFPCSFYDPGSVEPFWICGLEMSQAILIYRRFSLAVHGNTTLISWSSTLTHYYRNYLHSNVKQTPGISSWDSIGLNSYRFSKYCVCL
jgi:hypothetical protein